MKKSIVKVIRLGQVPYGQALALQLKLRKTLQETPTEGVMGYIVCLEHPPTVTLGKRGKVEDVLGRHMMTSLGIPLFQIDRGGEATAHEPGQLVIYPILRLNDYKIGVVDFIRGMAQCLINALQPYCLEATYDKKAPGLWTKTSKGTIKVASVGMRVSGGVTTHGAAINLINDEMSTFKLIVPCGMPEAKMASVRTLVPPDQKDKIQRSSFESSFLEHLATHFELELVSDTVTLPDEKDWPDPLEIEQHTIFPS